MARTFIPFGEFQPDRRLLANTGLLRAFGVVPLAGNYVRAPYMRIPGSPPGLPQSMTIPPPFGFHVHSSTHSYTGGETTLSEVPLASGKLGLDRTRAVGGAYAFASSPPGAEEFWWFCSYGDNVIATNFTDEVQFLATPGAGTFENMITSTFAPRAKLAFPVLGNLFLAHCALDAPYDGIAAGVHPQLVGWSQSHNIRAFGSARANPELIGAGYQQLDNDFGAITAGIGGDYGLIFQEKGIVRVDGPPYEFRPIVSGDSTIYPYSVFRLGGDVYFWGSSGPSVLRGGMPPVVRLTVGRLQRSLLDHVTGFGSDFARAANLKLREVSGAVDPVNELARWSFRPIDDAGAIGSEYDGAIPPTMLIDYNIGEDRFAVSRSADPSGSIGNLQPHADLFLRSAPLVRNASWGPHARTYFIHFEEPAGSQKYYLAHYRLAADELVDFNTNYPDLVLQNGFGRLDEEKVTRITSVRPVWTGTPADVGVVNVSVNVKTKNKPWEAAHDGGTVTTSDGDGWFPTPDTVYGSYHSVTITIDGSQQSRAHALHEIEGFEVTYEAGGDFGA